MRIISRSALRKFWEEYPEAKQGLEAWHAAVSSETWQTPNDVKRLYVTASVLKNGRVVFNVNGNRYRIVVGINYESQIVFVKFVGLHSTYDRIDAQVIEMKPRRR